MTISKAHWNTDGDNVRLSMPLTKVDKERRIVSGFASLDNLDKQDDIVTSEASMDAFARFRGNIREMHQPSAVGKMVSFKEDKYFDPETKKVLGVGIVGPSAGDIISEGVLAIEMGADAVDLGLTVHPHPTLGETIGMAAEAFEGTITDLYVPKK